VTVIATETPLHAKITRLGTEIINNIKSPNEITGNAIPQILAFFLLIRNILVIRDIIDIGIKNTKMI
jgi:hypothetical protein